MLQPLIGQRPDQAGRTRTPTLRHQILALPGRIIRYARGITLRLWSAGNRLLPPPLAGLRALPRPGQARSPPAHRHLMCFPHHDERAPETELDRYLEQARGLFAARVGEVEQASGTVFADFDELCWFDLPATSLAGPCG